MFFKIALIFFAVFAIHKAYTQYTKQVVSKYWLYVFSAAWILAILVALFPGSSDVVARVAGVGRGADLIVYVAVVVLLYAIYRLTAQQQKMNEEFTELVRRLAIENARKPE